MPRDIRSRTRLYGGYVTDSVIPGSWPGATETRSRVAFETLVLMLWPPGTRNDGLRFVVRIPRDGALKSFR